MLPIYVLIMSIDHYTFHLIHRCMSMDRYRSQVKKTDGQTRFWREINRISSSKHYLEFKEFCVVCSIKQ